MELSNIKPLKRVGRGGWGEVWLADDIELARQVAVKLFDPHSPDVSFALRHAQALVRVSHPNVVVVHQIGQIAHPEEGDTRDAIVMEYVAGPTLCDHLKGPPFPAEAARKLGVGLVQGLQALHESGTVHGDLHDENVLVTPDGTTKVIDILERFGLRHLPTMTREQNVARDLRALRGLLRDILGHVIMLDTSVVRAFDQASGGDPTLEQMRVAFERALGVVSGGLTGLLSGYAVGGGPAAAHADRVERAKEYLSEERHRIRLSDLVDAEIRSASAALGAFEVNERPNAQSFADRVVAYDEAVERLVLLSLLIARWGGSDGETLLARVGRHLANVKHEGGMNVWLWLQWYPLLQVMYATGIACEERQRYGPIYTLWQVPIERSEARTIIERVTVEMLELTRREAWKQVPGREREYTPLSEHLFGRFKALDDDYLMLGPSFETAFDRTELLYSLAHADVRVQRGFEVWGPIGRFGWKHRRLFRAAESPFKVMTDEAAAAGDRWQPLRDGLFGGDAERFKTVSDAYAAEVLAHVRW